MPYELNPFTKKLDKVGAVGGGGTTNITGVVTITPGGNTAGVTNAISSGSVMLAGGNNITLSQNGSTISFSGPNTVAQTQFVLSNSNGISFGTNGSTVTATVRTDYQPAGAYLTTARASNDAIGLATAGTNVTLTANSAGFSFDGGAYLTTAQPVGAYLTTARASNDAIGLNTALTGNGVAWTVNSSGLSLNVPAFLTTAAQSNHSHGNPTLALTNLSGTTASASNGLTLSLSAAAPGAGGGAALKGSGTYTQNTGTVEFANSNGITFGLSNNGTMTASHNGLTSQTIQTQNMVSVEGSTGNIDFANANGITFGFNASTITASHNGLTSQSNQAVSFTSGSVAFQTLSFTNSNGISFNSGTQGIFASHNALTTARASTDAIGLNTAQSNVTWTANSSGLSLDARGYAGTGTTGTNATFTLNSNGLQLNAGAYLTTAMASNRGTDFVQATAAFAGTNASGTIASNGISVSVAAPGAAAENNWFTLGGNVAGNSTASGSTIQLIGGANITLSGTNGSQIQVVGGGGGAGATFSYFRHPSNAPFNASSSQSFGASTMAIQPFQLPFNVSASYIRMPVSVGFGSTTFASGANTTHSLRQTNTYYAIVYSQGVGASSRSIQSIYSSSLTDVMQIDARVGAASNNQTVSHFFTHGATGNSSIGFTTGYSPAASSIVRVSTTHLTAFTGARFLDIPFDTLLAPGNYWLGIQVSSATAVSGTAAMNANTQRVSYYNMTQVSANVNEYGGNTTAGSNMWQGYGHGNWTTNTNGATTASINLAQVSTVANQPVFPFEFRRQA